MTFQPLGTDKLLNMKREEWFREFFSKKEKAYLAEIFLSIPKVNRYGNLLRISSLKHLGLVLRRYGWLEKRSVWLGQNIPKAIMYCKRSDNK